MAEEAKPEDQLSWGKRIKRTIFHPASRNEKIVCAVFWVGVAVCLGVVSFFALPKFFTKVVKPFLDLCKARLSKPTIAAICFAALSLLPIVLINPNLFIWLAAATLGSGLALILSLVANTVGMALPFLLCKWLVEDRVHRWAVRRDWVHALYLAAEEVGTFKVMVLMRLGPFPHALLNYIAATSRDIAFFPYITGSFVGSVPDVIIQVFVGTSVDGLADVFSGGKPTPGRIVSIVLPLIFGIILAVVAWVFTKRALARIRAQAEAHHPEHAQALEAEAMELGRLERGLASSLDGATTESRNVHKDSRRTRSLDGHAFVTRMSVTKPLDSSGSTAALLEGSSNSSPKGTQASAAPSSM